MSKKLAGKKFAGSHSTVIDAAYHLSRLIASYSEIEKISLGIIRQCSPGRSHRSLKIKETLSGFELIVRGNSYVQNIYLYLNKDGLAKKDGLSRAIMNAFEAKNKFGKM